MGKFINGVTDYNEWRDHAKDNKAYLERMAIISECLAKIAKHELSIIDEYRLVNAIKVSSLTGKLENFYAVSTSVLMNKHCQNRAKCKGCICEACYAVNSVQSRSQLTQSLETNYMILNNFLISQDVWGTLAIPSINGKARIEAHGDVDTVISAINYNRIVASHPHITFAVFTKNYDIWKEVFETEGKPDNMIFILSSPMVNIPIKVTEDMKKYVDHVFTVYEKEYAKENGIVINCGSEETEHKCKSCLRCYIYGTEFYINELKK